MVIVTIKLKLNLVEAVEVEVMRPAGTLGPGPGVWEKIKTPGPGPNLLNGYVYVSWKEKTIKKQKMPFSLKQILGWVCPINGIWKKNLNIHQIPAGDQVYTGIPVYVVPASIIVVARRRQS